MIRPLAKHYSQPTTTLMIRQFAANVKIKTEKNRELQKKKKE